MHPHVIRLNRAWEYRAASGEPLGRIDLPWLEAAEESPGDARLVLTRHFNGPSNLEPEQRVLLVLQPAELADQATLNDTPLDAGVSDDDCHCFDVARLLKRHNYLRVVAAPATLMSAEVRLVIQEIPSTPTGPTQHSLG